MTPKILSVLAVLLLGAVTVANSRAIDVAVVPARQYVRVQENAHEMMQNKLEPVLVVHMRGKARGSMQNNIKPEPQLVYVADDHLDECNDQYDMCQRNVLVCIGKYLKCVADAVLSGK